MQLNLQLNLGCFKGAATPSAWTPAQLGSALRAWYDANDPTTITLNGSNVSQWNDKSDNLRHLAQVTAANQPAYQATGFNSLPALFFDGTDDFISRAAFVFNLGSTSVFWAGRPDATIANTNFWGEGSTVGNLQLYTLGRTGSTTIDAVNFNRDNAGGNFSQGTMSSNGHAVGNAIIGATDTGSLVTGYRDGTQWPNTVAYTRGVTTLNTFALGAIQRATPLGPARMHMGEFVVAQGVLSTNDRQKLEGYLAWKWGLTANLPSGHPYKTTAPTI